ncbi:hypothetical protein TNCT_266351 [Trichonephila clavata]|uniref:Uncharacterized protein n=1 Tax=Trichonephila clavata TaxID=2740835 RepID=A0A8X6HSN0_TRICU|nr:hypothetical protein TNCT_266351 [Trichonephila clavata]
MTQQMKAISEYVVALLVSVTDPKDTTQNEIVLHSATNSRKEKEKKRAVDFERFFLLADTLLERAVDFERFCLSEDTLLERPLADTLLERPVNRLGLLDKLPELLPSLEDLLTEAWLLVREGVGGGNVGKS